jgi:hypothetical protein
VLSSYTHESEGTNYHWQILISGYIVLSFEILLSITLMVLNTYLYKITKLSKCWAVWSLLWPEMIILFHAYLLLLTIYQHLYFMISLSILSLCIL